MSHTRLRGDAKGRVTPVKDRLEAAIGRNWLRRATSGHTAGCRTPRAMWAGEGPLRPAIGRRVAANGRDGRQKAVKTSAAKAG